MQNEITELRTQVRTLRRIICLVCCVFVGACFTGCQSPDSSEGWPTDPGGGVNPGTDPPGPGNINPGRFPPGPQPPIKDQDLM